MVYFGERLKALRRERKLTQEQLADKMELVKSSISSYEKNAKYPSIEVLIKLCQYFDVSSDYLLGLSDKVELEVSELDEEQLELVMGMIVQFNKYNRLYNSIDVEADE